MPLEGGNPWHDLRYMTPAFLSRRGELLCIPIPRVHVWQMVNPYIITTGLLQALSGKVLMTVRKFCDEIVMREIAKDHSDESHRAVYADHSHLLARTRAVVRAARARALPPARPKGIHLPVRAGSNLRGSNPAEGSVV